jgi:hypothetical protein
VREQKDTESPTNVHTPLCHTFCHMYIIFHSQLNMLTAGCNFEMFLEKVCGLERLTNDKENAVFG